MTRHHAIYLRDERRLAVSEFGRSDGFPVVYMHGTPSTGNEWMVFGSDTVLEGFGLRLLAASRPGMGPSTYQANRSVEGCIDDLQQMLDWFEVDRFALLGYSGGAAYAVRAALQFESRIASLALVAPVCHAEESMSAGLDEVGLRLKNFVRNNSILGRWLMTLAIGWPATAMPNAFRSQLLRALPSVDCSVLQEGERLNRFVQVVAEAFRSGGKGASLDMALMTSPWSMPLRRLAVPTRIFQGQLDTFGARPAMAEYIAATLGTSDLRIYPEGHISIFASHVEEVLNAIADDVRPS